MKVTVNGIDIPDAATGLNITIEAHDKIEEMGQSHIEVKGGVIMVGNGRSASLFITGRDGGQLILRGYGFVATTTGAIDPPQRGG